MSENTSRPRCQFVQGYSCALPPNVFSCLHKHLSLVCGITSVVVCCWFLPQRLSMLLFVFVGSHYSQRSGSVESDLLRSIFYTRPRRPGALCSSWSTVLCDRCHIKQQPPPHTPTPPPLAINLLPKSFHCRSAVASQLDSCWTLCVCVCACAVTNEMRVSKAQACVHMFTLKHLRSPNSSLSLSRKSWCFPSSHQDWNDACVPKR